MSRDDSALYTGISSQSFAHVKQKKEKVKEQKQEAKSALEKNAHVVLERLDRELETIRTRNFDMLTSDASAETHKATNIALGMHHQFITGLRAEFINILGLKGNNDG